MAGGSYDVVIVGAGQAAGNLIAALRRRDYAGSICLVGDEAHPPHERPPLSKDVLLGLAPAESTFLVAAAELEQQATLLLSRRVLALDPKARRVTLDDGRVLSGGVVVLATGARARLLDLPGSGLRSVGYLRTIEDSLALGRALVPGARIVLIGGGTIGLEVASAASKQGLDVTVVEAAPRLLPRLLPPELSDWLAAAYAAAGVRLLLGRSVLGFQGQDEVEGVVLDGGEVLDADLVICGIGSQPNSELAEQAGLTVDNGIVVDEGCRSSAEGIFAIGDVASRRDPGDGRARRLESWDNALQQAERVADAICGLDAAPPKPSWFWTDQLGRNIQIAGEIPVDARASFRGDPAAGAFCALYHRDGRLVGAVAVDSGRDMRALREILQRGLEIPLAVLVDPASRLDKLSRAKPAQAGSEA